MYFVKPFWDASSSDDIIRSETFHPHLIQWIEFSISIKFSIRYLVLDRFKLMILKESFGLILHWLVIVLLLHKLNDASVRNRNIVRSKNENEIKCKQWTKSSIKIKWLLIVLFMANEMYVVWYMQKRTQWQLAATRMVRWQWQNICKSLLDFFWDNFSIKINR